MLERITYALLLSVVGIPDRLGLGMEDDDDSKMGALAIYLPGRCCHNIIQLLRFQCVGDFVDAETQGSLLFVNEAALELDWL